MQQRLAGEHAWLKGSPQANSPVACQPPAGSTEGSQAENPDANDPGAIPCPATSTRPLSAGHPFALHHRPGSVAILDHQLDQLERLHTELPRDWNVLTFASPNSCLNHLQQEPPRWEADLWAQQRIVERWRAGVPLVPQILRYWNSHPHRRLLTQACVCDDMLPGVDGLELFSELVDWPGYRILLNCSDDEDAAADALNSGLIDAHLARQVPQLAAPLTDVVKALLDQPDFRFEQIWSATFSSRQLELLGNPSVAENLRNFAQRSWVEWIAIGQPFGILGIDRIGNVSWLQLVASGELADPALASSVYAEPPSRHDISDSFSLNEPKLLEGAGSATPGRVVPVFSVGARSELLAAIQPLDTGPWGPARGAANASGSRR